MSDSSQSPLPDPRKSVLRYLDGTLPADDVTRLNEQLKSDVVLRREFAELLLQQVHLGDLGREARAVATSTGKVVPLPSGESAAPEAVLTFLVSEEHPGKTMPAWDRWRTPLAIAAGFILLLSLAVWWLPRTNNEPTLSLAPTATAIIERGSESFAARDQTRLLPGDVLRVTGTNLVSITYGSEPTKVTADGGVELKILTWTKSKHFELRRGKLEATVARQRPFQPMLITTPQARARVLGTRFTLAVTTNVTRLEVTEGKVRLTRTSDDTSVKVTAGHYAIAATNAELTALPATGRILREVWTNYPSASLAMPGAFMALMTSGAMISDRPNDLEYLTSLETPAKPGVRFGQRVCGYVQPPTTGEYRFYVSETGFGEVWLFLSPDDKPENQVEIIYDYTRPPLATPSPPEGNRSSPITLLAGRK